MAIKRFNVNDEEYFGDNIYLIHRPYILSNPYTHIKDKKTKAMFVVSSIEEAIEKYEHYFDVMYGKNLKFTKVIDEIYDKFKNGEEIMLGKEECYKAICYNCYTSLKKELSNEKENASS